jgi:hypothetical protein
MKKYAAIIFVGLILFSACAQDFRAIEKGNSAVARKVLVAVAASDFKMKVLDALVGALGTSDYYFKIVSPDALASEDAAPYGAIVLCCPVIAGNADRRITDFVKNHQDDARLILFRTQGKESPRPGIGKADSVTAASSRDRVGPKSAELAELVKKRFR